MVPGGRAEPGGLGDLLAAGARDDHRLVQVAVLAAVVHRQPGRAAGLAARATSGEGPRRPLATTQGVPSKGSFAHHCLSTPANPRVFPSYTLGAPPPDASRRAWPRASSIRRRRWSGTLSRHERATTTFNSASKSKALRHGAHC